MQRIALSIAAVALVLASVACAAPSDGEETGQSQDGLISGGGGGRGNGFLCTPAGCVCNPESDSIVDSCDGMAGFCDRIGKGMLCAPGGWCSCKVSGVSASTPMPTIPSRRPGAGRAP